MNHLQNIIYYIYFLYIKILYLTCNLLINQSFILLSNNTGIQKLYFHRRRYIEADKRHLIFHYGGKEISNYGKLSDLKNRLSKENCFRCNNSYTCNNTHGMKNDWNSTAPSHQVYLQVLYM